MLPNLICIGAAKCGTTSLHRYLDLHPEIEMAVDKELDFFTGPGWNWDRGLDWYEAKLPAHGRIRGETSHTYTVHPFLAGVPERIASVVPEARLLYLIGDPVERIISDWVGNRSVGWERRTLEELCLSPRFPDTWYLKRSSYHLQLSRYLDVFRPESILVVSKEDLARRRRQTLAGVFRFLGVDDDFYDDRITQLHNPSSPKRSAHPYMPLLRRVSLIARAEAAANRASGPVGRGVQAVFSRRIRRPALSTAARERVVDLLAPDVAALRELTGLALADWSL